MFNRELLKVYNFNKKSRLGGEQNNGYVLGVVDEEYDCYISVGKDENDNKSFSDDFIEKYKIKENNIFIINNDQNISCFTNNLIDTYNNVFLKMNIEGGEYEWLLNIDENQLKKIKQMIIQFHGITSNGYETNYNDKIKCLRKLTLTHYLIHAHGNNFGTTFNGFPDIIELTYLNKNCFNYKPRRNFTSFPIDALDYPKNPDLPDIKLNFYPFIAYFPKTIYFCNKTLDKMEKYSNNWKKLNPGYEIKLYNDEMCKDFLLNTYCKLFCDIFDFLKDGPIKADFWRVCILYTYGGVYSDIDNQPLYPLRNFIEYGVDFVTCTSYMDNMNFNPNFIIAQKRSIILKKCIDWYVLNYNNNKTYSYWDWSIMRVLTDVLNIRNYNKKRYGIYYSNNLKIQIIKECPGKNHYDAHNIYKGLRVFNNRYKEWDHNTHTFK
jgi:hypothetical protein